MRVSVAAFFLMMLFPLWGHLFPQPEVDSLEENRSMTELLSSGSLQDRIKNLEAYLDDHLAFRQTVIASVLRANLDLGESPHPSVLSGFDGWLYYLEGGEDFRRGLGLDREMIVELYDVQQQVADTFSAAGCDYRILVAPDKHSVYPQYLPLSSRMGTGPSVLDQMMEAPDPAYTVRFVDVRPALTAAAETGDQQYYKTDTHWSANGAFTACQTLLDALEKDHPSLHRLTDKDLRRTRITASGDLAAMIGQKGLREDHFEAVEVASPAAREDEERSDGELTVFVNDSIPDAPKMLLLHDSFGPAMTPFLMESVSELWLMSNDSPAFDSMGDLSRFDIVVFEVVERNRSWLWSGISNTSASGEEEEYSEEEYDEEDEYDDYEEE